MQRPWDYQRIPFQKKPRKLPEVLSQGEVSSLFAACANLKHRAILMTGYGCGLRVSETLALKPEHIDSKRMVVRVEQGKGRKTRYVMLPERLLTALREYWRACRPRVWMFEGEQPGRPLWRQTVHLVFRGACQKAGITKRASSTYAVPIDYGDRMLEDLLRRLP